jgi:hypothetical protein
LVVGFGAVGRTTTKEVLALPHEGPVDVYDNAYVRLKDDISRIGANPRARFPEQGRYDTVLGCTGYASFPVERTDILAQDALLVSGSSAAIEFNRERFIDLAYKHDDDDFFVVDPEMTRRRGIHATIRLQRRGRGFSFLNAGFPVNFDGRLESLPALIIQITHGLILAACQEVLEQSPGLHVLSKDADTWLRRRGLFWIGRYGKGAACT